MSVSMWKFRSVRSDWICEFSKIVDAIKRKAAEQPLQPPHRWLLSLAKNAEEYLKQWEVFGKELESMGLYMIDIMNAAYELVKCAGEPHQRSPGEFAEIIDDFRRYATIMTHRLTKKTNLTPSQEYKLRILNDKVVADCDVLLGEIRVFLEHIPDLQNVFPNVSYSNLNIEEEIGSGSYACVFKATWEGSDVAVKVFGDEGPDFQGELERLKSQALDSSHILKLLGRSENEDEKIFLILELMEDDLSKFPKTAPLSVTDLVEIIIQTAKGMRFLHSQNIVHRDLKPENILLRQKGKPGNKNKLHYLVKVADFGKSKGGFIDYNLTPEGRRLENQRTEEGHSLDQGTLEYMAPEMHGNDSDRKYTRLVDVFSFGITCRNVSSKIKKPISLRELITFKSKRPINLTELIEQSTQKDALQRPCFEVICEELWIVMQELLAGSVPHPMKHSKPPLTGVMGEGEYKEGEWVKVSFKLDSTYCVTSWIRSESNGKARIMKTETCNGPAEKITLEYRLQAKDVEGPITIMISSRYVRWYVTNDIHSVPTKWLAKEIAT